MNDIEPGEGWRLIDKHQDTPKEGDQFLYWNRWKDRPNPLMPWNFTHTYRRRIPAKPEPNGVLFYEWRVENEKAVIRIDMEKAEFNSKQARELANWLTQYADWQESQNDN